MFLGSVAYLLLCCFLLTHHCAQGQANKVSSKLDFDDMASNNNNNNNQTGVPVLIGQGQGQGQGQPVSGSYDPSSRTGSGGGGGGGGSATGSGNRPKIHGVRVTVDTGDGQQQTKESKESVEITDLGKHKKRVGIHTDITFEITAEGDANETSSAQQHGGEKEDASVPIYKGRASSHDTKHKSRAPHDPKSQWNPNYPSEHRGYERGGSMSGSGSDSYYPQYYPQHVYTSGSDPAADPGTWTHYVPVWTTERSPYEQSQLQRQPSWKPCYCMSSYGPDYRHRRDSKTSRRGVSIKKGVVKTHVMHINGKLEKPFS